MAGKGVGRLIGEIEYLSHHSQPYRAFTFWHSLTPTVVITRTSPPTFFDNLREAQKSLSILFGNSLSSSRIKAVVAVKCYLCWQLFASIIYYVHGRPGLTHRQISRKVYDFGFTNLGSGLPLSRSPPGCVESQPLFTVIYVFCDFTNLPKSSSTVDLDIPGLLPLL